MNTSVRSTARLLGAGLRALLVLTVICGVVYPLVVTGIAQAAFNNKANGSEIKVDGKTAGSALIGQRYDLPKKNPDDPQEAAVPDLKWFQPRPSNGLAANTINTQYKLLVSGATNLAADSEKLVQQVNDAKAAVVRDNSTADYKVKPEDVPADAVTSSASGLDPDISPQYAKIQAHRVAEHNLLGLNQVEKLVDENTDGRVLGFMGEPRVNVLKLNIELKKLIENK
ncbi:potassium-transporting ATPase subunit C [Streptomyces sp. NPDC002537]